MGDNGEWWLCVKRTCTLSPIHSVPSLAEIIDLVLSCPFILVVCVCMYKNECLSMCASKIKEIREGGMVWFFFCFYCFHSFSSSDWFYYFLWANAKVSWFGVSKCDFFLLGVSFFFSYICALCLWNDFDWLLFDSSVIH